GNIRPALLMSRSRVTWLALISSAASRTEASDARSRRTTVMVACGAVAAMLTAASRPRPASRQARMTAAPCSASTLAASKPIPEFAPVITTVRPAWSGTSATVHSSRVLLVWLIGSFFLRRALPLIFPVVRAAPAPGGGYARPMMAFIPSPPANGFHIGPAYIHFYGLMYVVGITAAILITQRRWKAQGGDPALVVEVGIWGGIALGALVGIWRVRRSGADVPRFMDAVAPALLVAQAAGRVGNYFNQELFGGPTRLPWGLTISPGFRPAGYARYTTFHPTFLYELIFDLLLAAFLVWLGHHRDIRPPGLFALYVTGYSAFRIF